MIFAEKILYQFVGDTKQLDTSITKVNKNLQMSTKQAEDFSRALNRASIIAAAGFTYTIVQAGKQNQEFTKGFDELKSNLNNLVVEIGTKLLPAVNLINKSLNKVLGNKSLSNSIATSTVAVGGFVLALNTLKGTGGIIEGIYRGFKGLSELSESDYDKLLKIYTINQKLTKEQALTKMGFPLAIGPKSPFSSSDGVYNFAKSIGTLSSSLASLTTVWITLTAAVGAGVGYGIQWVMDPDIENKLERIVNALKSIPNIFVNIAKSIKNSVEYLGQFWDLITKSSKLLVFFEQNTNKDFIGNSNAYIEKRKKALEAELEAQKKLNESLKEWYRLREQDINKSLPDIWKNTMGQLGQIQGPQSNLDKFISENTSTLERQKQIWVDTAKKIQEIGNSQGYWNDKLIKAAEYSRDMSRSIQDQIDIRKKGLTEVFKQQERVNNLEKRLETAKAIQEFTLDPIRQQVLQLKQTRDELIKVAHPGLVSKINQAYQKKLLELAQIQPVSGVAAAEFGTQQQVSMTLAAQREREASAMTKQMAIDIENKNANLAVERNTRDIANTLKNAMSVLTGQQLDLQILSF